MKTGSTDVILYHLVVARVVVDTVAAMPGAVLVVVQKALAAVQAGVSLALAKVTLLAVVQEVANELSAAFQIPGMRVQDGYVSVHGRHFVFLYCVN